MEQRTLLSVSVIRGEIIIRQTDADDVATVSFDQGGDRYLVKDNGRSVWIDKARVTSRSIRYFGLGGDDLFENGTDLRATAFGGRGDDLLVGSKGDDTLIGGRGNDSLYGRAGNDRLFGGSGNNLLVGGSGDDHRLEDQISEVQRLINQIRSVETFSNPTNSGQIVGALKPNQFPDPNAKNDRNAGTTGTSGLDAYPLDGRNTPGAFQVDLANLNNVFGIWRGTPGSAKNASPYDTEIAFSKDTLSKYFGIEVDQRGFITQISREAASVFLATASIASDKSTFDPLRNSLIGQHIDNLQSEQLSLYLAGRSPHDVTTGLNNDPRVVPDSVKSMVTQLQDQVARTFIWRSYQNYLTNGRYRDVFAKAQELFGSTLRIRSSQAAFGIKPNEVFLCKFKPGFIIGGGYVRGFNFGGMWDIIQAIVEADVDGASAYVDGTTTINISRSVKDGVKTFSVDKTPINLSADFPTIYHYGAVMSPFQVDMTNPAEWGISTAPFTMGYSRDQRVVTESGTATVPSGNGPYRVFYSDLAASKTLTINGPDTYWVVPTPADAVSTPVVVTNAGYNNLVNNNQTVNLGQQIDMSAYQKTMAEAYPNFFYVFTSDGADVVRHVSDDRVPGNVPLRMYYIPAAAGSVVTAQSAVLNGDFSQWSPYKDSYRVLLANRSILGTPSTSDQWGMHFIMTPPPPPPVGAGIIDASGSTGSQLLRVDQSISRVKLGAGAVTVQRESFNTSVAFVLNPGMAQGSVATIFENLNLDYDVVTLNRFTNVNDIKVKVEATFDTHSNAPAIAQYYKQFATTVRVSFSADVAGASRPFDFLVLVQSDANMSATQLRDKVRSRIATT